MKKRLAKMVAMATAMVLVIGTNSLAAFAAETETPQKVIAEWNTIEEADWAWSDVSLEEPGTVDTSVDTENDKSSAEISILAKVIEHGDIVYKVDISWGAMKFEFKNQTGTWNTETHMYDEVVGHNEAEWTADGYINGTNNLITVVNHSNWAVDTQYSYAHDLNEKKSMFNSDYTTDNAVRGHFFLTNDAAKEAAKVLTNSADVEDALDTAPLTLGHQDADNADMYGGGASPAYPHTQNVYFTFNGTPDAEAMGEAIKTDFTKVGVITVTIAPYEP